MELAIDRLTKQYKNKIAVDRGSIKLKPGDYGWDDTYNNNQLPSTDYCLLLNIYMKTKNKFLNLILQWKDNIL